MLFESGNGTDRKEKTMMTSKIKDCFHCAYADFDTTEEPCNRCLRSDELYPCWKSPDENVGQMTFDDLLERGNDK